MRKIPVNQFITNKQNKYDQTTNLGIDLESKIKKQVVLPKIASKAADSQIREFITRRKNKEDQLIQNLRDQVENLRRNVYLLDQKKLSSHLKTEDSQPYHDYYTSQRYMPKVSHHFQCPSCNFRTHQCSSSLRLQRNTEKSDIVKKRDSSYRNKIDKDKEAEFQKLQVNINSKQMKNTKAVINSNGSIVIEKEKPNLKKKRQNKQARRRLRKCIWTVYFSIFLPSLSRKIYLNRLKAFMLEYPHDIDKYYQDRKQIIPKIREDEADLWAKLQEKLDIMKAIQQAKLSNIFKDRNQIKQIKVRFQVMFSEDLNSSERQIHQPQTIQSQLFSSKNVEYLLEQFNQIFLKLMDNFSNFINTSDIFMHNWRSYSQGLLNNTFINNSYPKLQNKVIESGIVRLNFSKQTMQVYDQQTEILLLTFDIFCRIYCFNWFLKLKDNIPKYSQQNMLIANFFLTLLYIIGETMIEDRLKEYLKQKTSFEQSQRKRNKKIRFILPLMIMRKTKIDLKDVNRLIYDPPLWNDMSRIVLQKKESLDHIKEQMTSAGSQVYAILKEKIKEDLKQVKAKTLEEKYIITNDKERQELPLNYENFNKGDRVSQKLLNSYSKIKMSIKVNRKREGK